MTDKSKAVTKALAKLCDTLRKQADILEAVLDTSSESDEQLDVMDVAAGEVDNALSDFFATLVDRQIEEAAGARSAS